MLQDVLDLVRGAKGQPLSAAAIAGELKLTTAVAEHMLHVLVQRGKLLPVQSCAGCEVCPLHRFCAGSSGTQIRGYVISKSQA